MISLLNSANIKLLCASAHDLQTTRYLVTKRSITVVHFLPLTSLKLWYELNFHAKFSTIYATCCPVHHGNVTMRGIRSAIYICVEPDLPYSVVTKVTSYRSRVKQDIICIASLDWPISVFLENYLIWLALQSVYLVRNRLRLISPGVWGMECLIFF